MYEYKTIKRQISAEVIERKSRFISHVLPIENEQQALAFIADTKTKYWDASHNVYAYALKDNAVIRYSDDGEPSGTAGIPTLGVIQKEELLDICIVTTRYFGGTLLGAGGLVRAYTKSAKAGIDAAGIVRRIYCLEYDVITDYTALGKIQSAAANAGCIEGSVTYADNVRLQYFVPHSLHNFEEIIKEITGASAKIAKKGEGRYVDEK